MIDSRIAFNITHRARLPKQSSVESYVDFVVSESYGDHDFIVRQCNNGSMQGPAALPNSIDDDSATPRSCLPDFWFLGGLHEELKRISNLTLSYRINKCL